MVHRFWPGSPGANPNTQGSTGTAVMVSYDTKLGERRVRGSHHEGMMGLLKYGVVHTKTVGRDTEQWLVEQALAEAIAAQTP